MQGRAMEKPMVFPCKLPSTPRLTSILRHFESKRQHLSRVLLENNCISNKLVTFSSRQGIRALRFTLECSCALFVEFLTVSVLSSIELLVAAASQSCCSSCIISLFTLTNKNIFFCSFYPQNYFLICMRKLSSGIQTPSCLPSLTLRPSSTCAFGQSEVK